MSITTRLTSREVQLLIVFLQAARSGVHFVDGEVCDYEMRKMALGERADRLISLVTSLGFVSAFLLLAEVPLNAFIVSKVPCETGAAWGMT